MTINNRVYVYTVTPSQAHLRITIKVFRIERNIPRLVGLNSYEANSFYGERTCAKQIISKNDNIKMINDYEFESDDDIRIIAI